LVKIGQKARNLHKDIFVTAWVSSVAMVANRTNL